MPATAEKETKNFDLVIVHVAYTSLSPPLPVLLFKKGDTEKVIEVQVLHDTEREIREAFNVLLEDDENLVAEVEVKRPTNIGLLETGSV